MKKKYQIFISSTYKDLVEERKEVINTILRLKHIPIGMEAFNAGNQEQWELIKENIDDSDYYLLIVAGRYGSIHKEKGISYTELEYRYALEKKIPIIAFLKRDSDMVNLSKMDTEPEKVQKLKDFRKELEASRIIENWENKDELARCVATGIYELTEKYPREGWTRGNSNVAVNEHLSPTTQEKFVIDFLDENNEAIEELKIKYTKIKESIKYERLFLTKEHIPHDLLEVITIDQIDKYNESLPSKEEISKYNQEKRLFDNVKHNNLIKLKISIKNIDIRKVEDIQLILKIPEELEILEEYDVKNLDEPEELIIPESPIDKARREKILKLFIPQNAFMNKDYSRYNDFLFGNNHLKTLGVFRDVTNFNIEGKTLIFTINKILSTRNEESDFFYIISKKKGLFYLSYDLIADNLTKPIIGEIKVVVE